MSEYFGYECTTCGAYSEDYNRGDALLRGLAKGWHLIKQLENEMDPAASMWLELEIVGYRDLIPFLREHDGHAIWLVSEYRSRTPELLLGESNEG